MNYNMDGGEFALAQYNQRAEDFLAVINGPISDITLAGLCRDYRLPPVIILVLIQQSGRRWSQELDV